MKQTEKLYSQLGKDHIFLMALKGEGEYSHLAKRQDAVRREFIDKCLKPADESNFRDVGNKKQVIERLEHVFDALECCCKSFLSGDISNAISLMYACYFEDNAILKRIKIEPGNTFFRMRKASDYHLYDSNEMFHIPFEKNTLIKNERFSISGFPSLYLGKSVYVCWEELGKPDFNHANIALFSNKTGCEVVDLCMPSADTFMSSIYTLPLILYSSMPVVHTEDPFKPEYIIPQLLMQCLVKYNRENNMAIDGVRYDSIHKQEKNRFYDPQRSGMESLYENYVFPARQVSDKGLCPILSNIFDFGYCNSFGRYELEDYEIAKSSEETGSSKNPYEYSKFRAMEKHLEFYAAKNSMIQYTSLVGAQVI